MARESKTELMAEAVLDCLRLISVAGGAWRKFDRVTRCSKFPNDGWWRESPYQAVGFLFPGPERAAEAVSHNISFDIEFTVVGARRYSVSSEDPLSPPEEIVAAAAWANGALTIAAQPTETSQLTVLLRDDNDGISAGQVAIAGLDETGAVVNATFDVANGKEQSLRGRFASVSSAVISGAVGGGAGDVVRILAGPSEWQHQNRMAKDILNAIATATDLEAYGADVTGPLENVQVLDIDRESFDIDGWAVVALHLGIQYVTVRTDL